jgi:glycosyltransferase involved in cell wall biosynthesis
MSDLAGLVFAGRPARTVRGGRDAYMVVRNEAARLPHVLAYHRALGVERFFVADNGSTDGGLDYLAAQPDCHLYRAEGSFGLANCGMDWIDAMAARHGEGNWCLFVDADELFTYPHAETLSLGAFCAHLDARGDEGVFALLLDMYPRGPLAGAQYRPGTPFLDLCPHHDPDYAIRRKIPLRPGGSGFLMVEAVGGPRLRCFYPELAEAGPYRIARLRALRALRLHPLGRKLGLDRLRLGAAIPPDLTKVPLIKGAPGRRWTTNHRTTPLRVSPVRGALLHFKFFADFHARAESEASRGEHWDGGNEYARYRARLAADPGMTLFHPRSETFRSTARLVELGIMASTRDLDDLARLQARATPPVRALAG